MVKKLIYKLLNGWWPGKIYLACNITNVCNRACDFCPYHAPELPDNEHTRWFKSQPRNIFLEEIEMVVDKLHKRIKFVSITGKGEPMLNPDFLNICRYINKKQIPFSITTNADYLNEPIVEILSGLVYLKEVRISVYKFKQIANTLMFCGTIPIRYFNQTEKELLDYMGEPLIMGFTTQNFGAKGEMPLDFNKATFCKTPYSMLTVNTDGSIVPCYSYHETANIHDTAHEILKGKRIREYRKKSVNGRNCPDSDCKNCYSQYGREC